MLPPATLGPHPAADRSRPLAARSLSRLASLCPPTNHSKERKALALERKAKRVKNFGLIQEVVQLWEDARRHDASVAKRSKLISTILSKARQWGQSGGPVCAGWCPACCTTLSNAGPVLSQPWVTQLFCPP